MSKKKHILRTETNTQLLVLGISSTETEFQISLLINEILSVKLTAAPPVVQKISNDSISFKHFAFHNNEDLEIKMIKNKSGNHLLAPNLAIFDYLLLFTGTEAKSLTGTVLNKIKNLPNITLISEIDSKKTGKLAQIIY